MAIKYKSKAFVYKKSNVNEADKIFSVFTDNFGRLDIFAKAIRKINSKLRGGIDIFSLSEIEFIQGKSRKTLTDANIIKRFAAEPYSLEKNETAYKIAEVVDKYIKGQEKDSGLFNLLKESFLKLDGEELKDKKLVLVYYYFLWNALSLLGYRSEVNECARCSKKLMPSQLYFSGKHGGVICGECADKEKNEPEHCQKINADIVKILRIILLKDWATLSKLKIEDSTQKSLLEVSENAMHSFSPNYS